MKPSHRCVSLYRDCYRAAQKSIKEVASLAATYRLHYFDLLRLYRQQPNNFPTTDHVLQRSFGVRNFIWDQLSFHVCRKIQKSHSWTGWLVPERAYRKANDQTAEATIDPLTTRLLSKMELELALSKTHLVLSKHGRRPIKRAIPSHNSGDYKDLAQLAPGRPTQKTTSGFWKSFETDRWESCTSFWHWKASNHVTRSYSSIATTNTGTRLREDGPVL